MLNKFIATLLGCMLALVSQAAPLSYELKPKKIAENTWVFQGELEDFTKENGGNIINTGFIVTNDGVVVFETGPSLRYGMEMREAIKSITSKPIKLVFNLNHHPDHFLGNQAFSDADIVALPGTEKKIAQLGDVFAGNMYRLVGDWMRSTEVHLPSAQVDPGILILGNHRLRLMQFIGHSGSDLVVLDERTGVLFASGMVFYQRALTTPSTPGLGIWIQELKEIKELDFKTVVPAHGLIVNHKGPIDQTIAYLNWMDDIFTQSAQQGLSMTEVIKLPIPEKFRGIKVKRREFERSVAHLYPKYEEQAF